MSNPLHRQSGRTTLQMVNAPKGATYVVPCSDSVLYMKQLSRGLNRGDLRIESLPSMRLETLQGKPNAEYVVDHAVWDFSIRRRYGPRTEEVLDALRERVHL